MRAFSELYDELDATTSTREKVEAMARYFGNAPAADAAWAVYILSGRRLKRFIGQALLRRWLIEAAALPEWLLDEAYASVGDLAETIALLMEGGAARASEDVPLAAWIEERLLPLRGAPEERQREQITAWWRTLPSRECFLLNKLLTGELRVGVSQLLVTRALAEALELPRADLSRRLMGEWQPSVAFWESLRSKGQDAAGAADSAPYPFFLASPLESEPEALGPRSDWLAEWKWDGIRGQLIRRKGQCFLWSRGEDLVTERFPEIAAAALALPEGSVLDGEIVAWRNGAVQPFADLQQRIGRKKLIPAVLERVPVRFLAYDLLEAEGRDVRALPLEERRERLTTLLESLAAAPIITISPAVHAERWEELARLRAESRSRGVEGLMLKALASPYGVGRQRGSWWKWKVDPYSFDGVMLYAEPGHGRRSNLYTDYTFGVWRGEELLPVAKAYSGLSDEEIRALDRWIREHTQEKFGPVRKVQPAQVFEVAFEGIAASSRHKSGIALRFPRILRWRLDKPARDADSLELLHEILRAHHARAE
jgi:DNA ligase 1